MRFDRRRLTFLAVCVLDEACDQPRLGKVPALIGMRLALANLHAAGDRRHAWFDREPYETFWRAATQSDLHGGSAAAFGRSQQLTSSLNAIARASGMERDVSLTARMSEARKAK
ncbi:MAG: hypothetical protein JWR80_2764 [Bradyrhizobium sp.]|nr:hypothetical protein [Bradyrhizobium sp.]